MRIPTREHTQVQPGERGSCWASTAITVKVRNVKTGQTVYRQCVSWDPENSEFQGVSDLGVGSWSGRAITIEEINHLGRMELQSELPAPNWQPEEEPSQPVEGVPQEEKQEGCTPALCRLQHFLTATKRPFSVHALEVAEV